MIYLFFIVLFVLILGIVVIVLGHKPATQTMESYANEESDPEWPKSAGWSDMTQELMDIEQVRNGQEWGGDDPNV